jgi:Rrf2 family nitric oxide-sensitive transcriptional repressor
VKEDRFYLNSGVTPAVRYACRMDTILRISDAANLGIHAMAHIARAKGGVNQSVGEIAAHQGVSEAHLSKVMQRLVKVGLLTSRRGPGGGFLLGRAAESISLLEILEAMDGPMSDNKCMLGRKNCLFGGCALGALLTHVNHQVRIFMASRKLTDLTGSSLKHTLYLAGLGGQNTASKKTKAKRKRKA